MLQKKEKGKNMTTCAPKLLFQTWNDIKYLIMKIHMRRKANDYSMSKFSLCNCSMRQDCKLPVFSVVASIHFTVPFKH